ncbi:MAG: diguanylate cyclase [Rhodobacteraceae bacterium]|nr:diguanylate cyclase [Paracoccaceae bacterium]
MARRILVVDDIATNRLTLRVSLAAMGYEVLQAVSAREAVDLMALAQPDLVIVSDRLDDMNGADLCAQLKDGRDGDAAPVIVMTSGSGGVGRIAALRAGADELLSKPVDDLTLAARVRSLLRARETHLELIRRQSTATSLGLSEAPSEFRRRGLVALVSSNPSQTTLWQADLARHGRDRIVQLTPEAAIAQASDEDGADVYVLGNNIQRPGGVLALVSDLRSVGASRYAAILTAHSPEDKINAAAALDLGANDILPLPHDPEELSLRVRSQMRRKQTADRLRQAIDDEVREAVRDPLTGLYNRRYGEVYLRRAFAQARSKQEPLTVLMVDIDHFKGINDTHGHASGDQVLRHVAEVLKDNLRGESVVARWGGEEFMAVLPGADASETRIAARRLCEAIAEEPFLSQRVALGISVTASIGAAIAGGAGSAANSPHSLVERADQALYRAKAAGRNTYALDVLSA